MIKLPLMPSAKLKPSRIFRRHILKDNSISCVKKNNDFRLTSDIFVYSQKTKPSVTAYKIFTAKGEDLGQISLKPIVINDRYFYPDSQGKKALYITHISRNNPELIEFAKTMSKKTGADGRLATTAINDMNPRFYEHYFFIDNGFTAYDENITKQLELLKEFNIKPNQFEGIGLYLKDIS